MVSRGEQRLAAALLISLGGAACTAADGDQELTPAERAARPQVIDGAATPEELGFEVNRLERHAALGQLFDHLGQTYQVCSGTLVGDRVVVTAGHCVVGNFEEWSAGAEPDVMPDPSKLHYAIGDNVDEPLCMTTAQEIHLHPDAKPEGSRIEHDCAIIILEESVWDSCEAVMPVQINREPMGDERIGERVLQGGFGSLDGSYNFSPQRFWSLVEIIDVGDMDIDTIGVEQGLPTYGDSGSGVWRRFDDGSLRTLGQYSTISGVRMRFSMNHVQAALLDEVVDESLICGPVDETGTCRDGLLVRCDAQGFSAVDCRATEQQCVVGDDGTPGCACGCDDEPYCQEDCPCDEACPCACDIGEGCQEGCDCDPDCYGEDPEPEPTPGGNGGDDGGCSVAEGAAEGMPASGGFWLGLGLLGWSLRRRGR